MLISNPLQKTKARKVINDKVTENRVFYFYYCVQNCSAYNFFRWTFFEFLPTALNSASNFVLYSMIPKKYFSKKEFWI